MSNRAIYFERSYLRPPEDYVCEYRFFGIPEEDVKYGGLMTTYTVYDDVDMGTNCSYEYTALDAVIDLMHSYDHARHEGHIELLEYVGELRALAKYLKGVEAEQMRLRAMDRVDEIDDEIERLRNSRQQLVDAFLGN